MTTPGFTVYERDLPDRLGVPRETVRELREKHLLRGSEWAMSRGQVVLTAAGAQKLEEAAKNAAGPAPADSVASDQAPDPPATAPAEAAASPCQADAVELTICRVGLPNWRIVIAKTPAGSEVLVRTNAQTVASVMNFRPGMVIRAVPTEHSTYQQVGRAPRFPGRW